MSETKWPHEAKMQQNLSLCYQITKLVVYKLLIKDRPLF